MTYSVARYCFLGDNMADEEEGHDQDHKCVNQKSMNILPQKYYKEERMDVFPARISNLNKPFEKSIFPDFTNLDVKTESGLDDASHTRVIQNKTALLKTVTVDITKLGDTSHKLSTEKKDDHEDEKGNTPKKRKSVSALSSPVKKKKIECSNNKKKPILINGKAIYIWIF